MVKSFFYGLLVGAIIGGILWYSFGRNDLREVRSDLNRVDGDFQEVQRDISKLGTDSDGFAGDLIAITTGLESARDRLGSSNDGLSQSNSLVREQLAKMEQLADWHKQSLVLGRDLGDLAFDVRRLSEASRETD